mmetsp:Transcript_24007/g.36356  ORF Transcript_24007/g.36356 Transcript_24007/m.36356 type:complete len:208 (+) Transcript_24007:1347-1970(+)
MSISLSSSLLLGFFEPPPKAFERTSAYDFSSEVSIAFRSRSVSPVDVLFVFSSSSFVSLFSGGKSFTSAPSTVLPLSSIFSCFTDLDGFIILTTSSTSIQTLCILSASMFILALLEVLLPFFLPRFLLVFFFFCGTFHLDSNVDNALIASMAPSVELFTSFINLGSGSGSVVLVLLSLAAAAFLVCCSLTVCCSFKPGPQRRFRRFV